MLTIQSPVIALMCKQFFINLILQTCFVVYIYNSSYAQQPIRPITNTGSCPLGYYSSGNYCLSNLSNEREAIQKTGNSCPLGWFSSGSYCLKSR